VICYAREGGATFNEIKKAASERCGPIEETECDCARLEATIRIAETALALAVAVLLVLATKGKSLPAARKAMQKAIQRGITIEGEVIKDVKALENLASKAPQYGETMQRAINELSLAQREAFALRGVVIKP